VPHDGVWIRDFGPQIEAAGDSISERNRPSKRNCKNWRPRG
jgi:hypothetical protein